jgi:ferric-dicitrate binding protein FerR (iron transport regulator)
MDNQHSITDLLIKKLAGSANEEELSFIEEEMQRNPSIRKEWEELVAIYSSEEVKDRFNSVDVHAEYRRLVKRYYRPRRYLRLTLAAAITLFVIGVVLYLLRPNKPVIGDDQTSIRLADGTAVALTDSGTIKAGKATFHASGDSATYEATGPGGGINTLYIPRKKNYSLSLSDGTTIKLNNATTLKFPFTFTGSVREVYLDGEAYFTVAPDPKRPFIVRTRYTTVEVLGTVFNINTYNTIKVSLAEGAISVSTAKDTVRLTPGYQVRADSITGKLRVTNFDPDIDFSWLTNHISYQDESIKVMATEAERIYDVKIIIDRKELEKERFTGRINKDKSVEDFLANVKRTFLMEYRIDSTDEGKVIHFY